MEAFPGAIEARFGVLEAHPGAVEVHPGDRDAHPGAMELTLRILIFSRSTAGRSMKVRPLFGGVEEIIIFKNPSTQEFRCI
jgi:hypothetical protein